MSSSGSWRALARICSHPFFPCRSNVEVFVDRDKEGEAGRKEGRKADASLSWPLASERCCCQRSTGEGRRSRLKRGLTRQAANAITEKLRRRSAEMSTAFFGPVSLLGKLSCPTKQERASAFSRLRTSLLLNIATSTHLWMLSLSLSLVRLSKTSCRSTDDSFPSRTRPMLILRVHSTQCAV